MNLNNRKLFIVYFVAVVAMLVLTMRHACANEVPPEPAKLCDATCLHHKDPATMLYKGMVYTLPPGYTVPEPIYNSLDMELKRLQTQETRLAAENESLRKSAKPKFSNGIWAGIGLGLLAGFAIGYAL